MAFEKSIITLCDITQSLSICVSLSLSSIICILKSAYKIACPLMALETSIVLFIFSSPSDSALLSLPIHIYSPPPFIWISSLIGPLQCFFSPIPSCYLFTFLASVVTSWYILKSKHLELEFTSERRVFVPLHLCYPTQYNIFQTHSLTWKDGHFIFPLKQNRILMYICTTFLLSIYQMKNI